MGQLFISAGHLFIIRSDTVFNYSIFLFTAKRNKHLTITCMTCGSLKRFLSNNDYILWSERAENLLTVSAINKGI